MKNFTRALKILGLLAILGFTIYLCFRNSTLESQVQELTLSNGKTDTVYAAQSFKPTLFPNRLKPEEVKIWRITENDYHTFLSQFGKLDSSVIRISNIGNQSDSSASTLDSIQSLYNRSYSTVVQSFERFTKDKIPETTLINSLSLPLQFKFSQNNLEVTIFDIGLDPTVSSINSINSKTERFLIDTNTYEYSWYRGNLSYRKLSLRKRLQFKPYLYGKYRPFNNFTDLGLGISFKTNQVKYKLGVNTFYYPSLKGNIGTDLEFSLEYNF
jgi:hypothetical protein|nr:MAG TPA: hypothetical protein [Caudoviricetes sp.]